MAQELNEKRKITMTLEVDMTAFDFHGKKRMEQDLKVMVGAVDGFVASSENPHVNAHLAGEIASEIKATLAHNTGRMRVVISEVKFEDEVE